MLFLNSTTKFTWMVAGTKFWKDVLASTAGCVLEVDQPTHSCLGVCDCCVPLVDGRLFGCNTNSLFLLLFVDLSAVAVPFCCARFVSIPCFLCCLSPSKCSIASLRWVHLKSSITRRTKTRSGAASSVFHRSDKHSLIGVAHAKCSLLLCWMLYVIQ